MKFSAVVEHLRKRGYSETEPKENYRVFYEFGTLDFLITDAGKKFECRYKDDEVEDLTMTLYWFGTTTFKTITTIEELIKNA